MPKLNLILHRRYFLPLIVFLFTFIPLFINLFNYPVFLGDEGIYTFQGWWLANFSKLAPYAYWYDHAPFGWLMIGLWQKLTGGPFTFGFSLHSTRIFTILLVSLTNVFIYWLLEAVGKSKKIALIACLVFAFTPLNLIYHRQVLLDNIETFWLILSLLLLFKAKKRSLYFLTSGIFYGLAFLSKEIVIFILPVVLLGLWWESKGENKTYSRLLWLSSAGFLVFLFPLMAILKGEFLPPTATEPTHVSFLQTVIFQLSRGSSLKPWESGSYFRLNLADWFRLDFFLMAVGLWGLIVNLADYKNKRGLFFSLLGINYLLFLARGGFILGFYVIPLLAIFSINAGLAVRSLGQQFRWLSKLRFLVGLGGLFLLGWLGLQNMTAFTANVTNNQRQVIDYIKKELPSDSVVVLDDFAFLDIRLSRNIQDKAFDRAEWYSKVENDPEIRMAKLNNDWHNIDYLMVDDYIKNQMESNNLPFLRSVWDHADLVREFSNGEETRGGILVGLYKLNKSGLKKAGFSAASGLSLEQKVGSLFMVGFEGTTLDEETKNFLLKNNFKHFLLLARNIDNPDQVKALTAALRNIPGRGEQALVVVDEEGGQVNRINFNGVDTTPQAEITTTDQAYQVAQNRAAVLKELGINVNLAPVLEISRSRFSYISRLERTFSDNEEEVYSLARSLIKGYEEGGITSVVKHYPFGLGRTAVDPHQTLPIVDITLDDLAKDLVVLKRLLETDNAVAAVMATHIVYPEVDNELPSSLSPIFISKILRRELGFQGVIVSDDLSMGAITNHFPIEEAAKAAVKAGDDLMIISTNPFDQQQAYQAVLAAVKTGEITEEQIDEAVERINRLRD